jgi:hypothetical protein
MLLMRLTLALAIGAASAASVGAQNTAKMRFQAMDSNGDGVITQAEWRGSPRAFERNDWNRDGILSGDEVRVGAPRDRFGNPVVDPAEREYVFDDWTTRGFRSLDHNRDNRISRDEWHFDREDFRFADRNSDGVITRAEFFGRDQGTDSEAAAIAGAAPNDLFASADVDRDRVLTLDEWPWSRASFNERDRNDDNRVTRAEFHGTAGNAPAQSTAYRAGFERGQAEGREAGRLERINNRAWDLEGQRELESADSGYQPGMGPRAEYQAGYRDGFRRGYRTGWDEAKN